MKHSLFPLLTGLVIACAQSAAQSPSDNEHLSKTFSLPNGAAASVLVIYNINGPITVEGTSGNGVNLEVDKQLTARTKDDLETGKKEFKLAFEQHGDTIMAYIAEPFDSRPNRDADRRNNWRNNNDHHMEYDYTLDFTVKVPRDMNVHVSTVNRGEVRVSNVSGRLHVNNVNGAIALTNVRGATKARTVNGNVDASYLANPPEGSSYYTLNGNINVSYPADMSADLQFKTFRGEFYTDFPNAETLPVQVVKTQQQQGDKTVYKLDKTSAIRIGSGGKTIHFETFNGSVYIKKQS